MIRVIFTDSEGEEIRTITYDREKLKRDSFERMRFAQDVNHQVCHVIGKLREEVKEEIKCQRKSVL